MFRRPIDRAMGSQALKRGLEFGRAVRALAEKNPWTLKQDVDVVRDRTKPAPTGSSDTALQDAGDLAAVSGRKERDSEHVRTRCVVLLVPGEQLPRNEQRVTNEGGLIRFALGASNDQDMGAR